jgi:hypothetical protein
MRLPSQYETLTRAVKRHHSARVNALLATCTDKEFCVLYFKLLPFVMPKLKKVATTREREDQEVKIVHVYPKQIINQ